MVTLTGLAGVGTTSVARAVVAGHPSTVPFVDARRTTQPGALAQVVLDAVATSDLVIVDDADRAPEARAELTHVLHTQPMAQIITTASAPLRVPGETVVRVPPLPLPGPDHDPEEYAEQPAVRLFLEASARAGAAIDLDEPTLRDVAAICAELGGVPQAIVMAAARTPTLAPSTLRDLLVTSSPSAVIPGRVAEDGHDLFTTIAWSESLLDELSRRLLSDLAVFCSAVPLEAVLAVCEQPDLIESLSSLVDAHLVEPLHGGAESRYRLSPLVRERAAQALHDDPEREAALAARHTAWAATVARRARDLQADGRPSASLRQVGPVEPEILAALERAVTAEDVPTAVTLLLGIASTWFNRAPTQSELAWVQRVGGLAQTEPVAPADRAMLLAWRGAFAIELARDADQVAAAMADLLRARELAEPLGGPVLVRTLALTVIASRVMGDRSLIEPLCERGREVAGALGNQTALANFEAWAGMLAHQRGDVDTALRWGRTAFERARRSDEPQALLVPAGLLRTLPPGSLTDGGSAQIASDVPPFGRLLDLARRSGDLRSVAWLLPTGAAIARHKGDRATAASLLLEALQRTRASGSPLRGLLPLMSVVLLAQDNGDDAVARRLQEAVVPYRQVLEPTMPPWIREAYGARIFEHAPAAVGGSGLAGVQAGCDLAIDYLRSLGAAPVIRLAPPLLDPALPREHPEELTEREREVLETMTSGASNKEISRLLGISTKTVMHHTSAIYRKLGVRGRSEAVAWALRHHRPASGRDDELAAGS